MDSFMLIMLGIFLVWLGISTAIYALLHRRFGLRIEKAWKRAAFIFGCSAVLSPGLLLGLGHGIAFFPAGLHVIWMLLQPSRFDIYFQAMAISLGLWSITAAVFYVVGQLQRRRKIGV
jgi:hypothetical protein